MDGVIPVWKECGMTSHDVVFKMRKLFKQKRIGHCGTLDPEVQGVLVVCLGQATKLVEFLMEGRKVYQGEIYLGRATDTEDGQGQTVESKRVNQPIPDQVIDQTMAKLTGSITQIPPLYSAVKVKGRRLYEYARAGIPVERPQRQVQIYNFVRTQPSQYDSLQESQTWPFEVSCSKGTYIRTLAVDCGQLLGYPSHMASLTRIEAAGFSKDQSYRLDQLKQLLETDQIHRALIPLEKAVKSFPRNDLSTDLFDKVKHGQVLDQDDFEPALDQETACFYQGRLEAIYGPHPEKIGKAKPIKMFPNLEV